MELQKQVLTKKRPSYTDEEKKIALSDITVKEAAKLLPGRTLSAISAFRSHIRKKSKDKDNFKKPPVSLSYLEQARSREMMKVTNAPEITIEEKIVPKQKNILIVVDGVSLTIDKTVNSVIVTKEAVVINR